MMTQHSKRNGCCHREQHQIPDLLAYPSTGIRFFQKLQDVWRCCEWVWTVLISENESVEKPCKFCFD